MTVYNNRPQQAQPLWAIFDIYGNTLCVELINNQVDSNESQTLIRQNNSQSSLHDTLESSFSNDSNIYVPLSELRLSTNRNNAVLSSTHRSSLDSSAQSLTSSSLNSSNNSSSSSYNNITVISNHRNHNRDNNVINNNNEEQLNRLFISCRRLCVDNHLNETLHSSILDASNNSANLGIGYDSSDLNEKIRNFYQSIPVLIHDQSNNSSLNRFLKQVKGKNVKISEPDGLIAYRESSIKILKDRCINSSNRVRETVSSKEPTRNAYSFLESPIQAGKSFCIQIVGIDQSLGESKMSLGIGCTTCKPLQLSPQRDLPDDADDLLDRPEYWIVYKNLFNTLPGSNNHQISVADELCFCVDKENGNLSFYINNQLVTNCLFNVDSTQELYFFFDLCGKTNAIRVIPSCQSRSASSSVRLRTTSRSRLTRPNSALIEYYKNQFLEMENISESSSKNSDFAKKKDNLEECRICLDAPIECVFYTCGHMCVCWSWFVLIYDIIG